MRFGIPADEKPLLTAHHVPPLLRDRPHGIGRYDEVVYPGRIGKFIGLVSSLVSRRATVDELTFVSWTAKWATNLQHYMLSLMRSCRSGLQNEIEMVEST